ncbi:MAG: hypothetical protein ACTJLK_01590 [Anaplasma sp.]
MRFSRIALLVLVVVAMLGVQGCVLFSKAERRIKSPCVRVSSDGECERRPVNQWWLG